MGRPSSWAEVKLKFLQTQQSASMNHDLSKPDILKMKLQIEFNTFLSFAQGSFEANNFPFVYQMVVLAQRAGGTTVVQEKVGGGSLISTSGTLTVTVAGVGGQAAMV